MSEEALALSSPASTIRLTRALCIAISYCCVLLPYLCHAAPQGQRVDHQPRELSSDVDPTRSDLLIGFLNAEHSAVEHQLELYRRKATLLKALLAQYEEDEELRGGTAKEAAATATSNQSAQSRRAAQLQQSRQRAYRQQQQHSATQRFSDWFDLQGYYYPPVVLLPSSQENKFNGPSESSDHHDIRLDLLSFRPNASPNGKKSHNAQRGGRQSASNHLHAPGETASYPLLQFLATFDMKQGRLDLHHPITKELVWQHELFMEPRSVSPITDYFFASERLSYLATVRANGQVTLYKLRVLHNRRLLSGDHRIPSKSDRAVCFRSSYNQHLLKTRRNSMGIPINLPWRSGTSTNTLAAASHPHIDFELIFSTNPHANNGIRTEKAAVVTFFSHSYVITANSEAELSLFHGENGTFITSLATGWFTQDSGASGIMQFHVLTTGIVAAAVGNRIHFVNPLEQTLVNGGVTCDGGANEKITSVDSDPWRYSTIYAGTSSGRVLVFQLLNFDRLRKSGSGRRQQPPPPLKKLDENGNLVYDEESEPACVLVDQLRTKPELPSLSQTAAEVQTQTRHQTGVRAIPGYVVMTTNSEIVLFQTSYEGLPTYVTAYSTRSLLGQQTQNSGSNTRTEQFVALSAARDPSAHPVALAVHVLERLANDTTSVVTSRLRVDVYESLLPQPTSSLDLGWLRVPIMLLCAVAVMYWQQQNNSGSSKPGQIDLGAFGGGSQRGTSSADFDVSKFSKMAAARSYPQHHYV